MSKIPTTFGGGKKFVKRNKGLDLQHVVENSNHHQKVIDNFLRVILNFEFS